MYMYTKIESMLIILLSLWICGYLFHMFPLPVIFTWWAFPWLITIPFISFTTSLLIVNGIFHLYNWIIKYKNKFKRISRSINYENP